MNELVQEVTPLTRAIVWLRREDVSVQDPHYQAIDYLLDGLLTASLKENASSSALLVGRSYDRKLYVFATTGDDHRKDSKKRELESFFTLLSKDINSEDRILLVDDVDGREAFLKLIPQKVSPHVHVIN